MPVFTPWSQILHVSWPPGLRYYDERTHILHALEDAHLLPSFRWDERAIGARLGPAEILEISSERALLLLVGPAARVDEGRRALAIVLDILQPDSVHLEGLLLQHLVPVADSYTAVRRKTGQRLLGDLLPGQTIVDWAFLVDGVSTATKVPYQVEFGLINADEAPDRVGRRVGRIHFRTLVPIPDDFFVQGEYPEVGLFMDWHWSPGKAVEGNRFQPDLVELWDGLVSESAATGQAIWDRSGLGSSTGGVEAQL